MTSRFVTVRSICDNDRFLLSDSARNGARSGGAADVQPRAAAPAFRVAVAVSLCTTSAANE
ncbi:hypothetical protein GCM10009847_14870 [Leucobacter tardus]